MNKEVLLILLGLLKEHLTENKSLRFGQALFNIIDTNFPQTKELRGSEVDPFYKNKRIPAYMEKVFELTNATQEARNCWYQGSIYKMFSKN